MLWVGSLVSNAGSWMHRVASAWVLYEITGSAAWLGIDAMASGLSTGLLLPWGGAVADRADRRRVIILGNLASAIVVVLLAVVAFGGELAPWHVVVISVATGVATAFVNPASSALLPNVVGAERVVDAISLNSMQFNAARVVGPVLAGLVLVRLGPAWCFAFNAVSFGLVAVAVGCLRHRSRVVTNVDTIRKEIIGGLRFVLSQGELRSFLTILFATAFLAAPVVMLLPPLVRDWYSSDATAFSMLVTAFGAGAIVGAFAIPWLVMPARPGWANRVGVAIVFLATAQALLVFSRSVELAFVMLVLCGAIFVGLNVVLGTALVQKTPDEYRGRMSSLQAMGFRTAQPLGALCGGLITNAIGVRVAFVSMSVALAATGATFWIRTRTKPIQDTQGVQI